MGRIRIVGLLCLAACGGGEEGFEAPPCGSFEGRSEGLLPGPGAPGHDAELEAIALEHDRLWHAVHAASTGLNADYRMNGAEHRATFEQFVASGAYDFEAETGMRPEDLGQWGKSAGLYGGVGVAADAYRYGVLRDLGAECADVERARAELVRGLEGMDIAARITGVPGVMARAVLNHANNAATPYETTPLFDADGDPLPEEKNNGTWRDDQSGELSDWQWEDSLSRDMLVGWAMAFGAAWEVIREDDTIGAAVKARLQKNAGDVARGLMVVGELGYDLEIPDADGRPTFHAYLHESSIDRLYIDGAENGFNAVMALGIVGALAYAAEDEAIDRYVQEELIERRDLPGIAAEDLLFVGVGVGSNFSNFNMAFTAMFLAQRYVRDPDALTRMRLSLRYELWAKDGVDERRPVDMGQSFFDYIYAAGDAESHVDHASVKPFDAGAVERGTKTLVDFPRAPYFDDPVENCDAEELASQDCVLNDGMRVRVLGEVGWKGTLVADQIVPMAVRPSSNYHWRSDPYRVNSEGSGLSMNPAVDFRIAYWLGRWVR